MYVCVRVGERSDCRRLVRGFPDSRRAVVRRQVVDVQAHCNVGKGTNFFRRVQVGSWSGVRRELGRFN